MQNAQYEKEFYEAFRSLDWVKIKKFCRKWKLPIPEKDIVFKAGVYTVILYMRTATDKEKAAAAEWLTSHGFDE